jgi:hypothetical protein
MLAVGAKVSRPELDQLADATTGLGRDSKQGPVADADRYGFSEAASRQAVTQLNVEQASRSPMSAPPQPLFGGEATGTRRVMM